MPGVQMEVRKMRSEKEIKKKARWAAKASADLHKAGLTYAAEWLDGFRCGLRWCLKKKQGDWDEK